MAKMLSCGTLIVNPAGELLLCHVTHTPKWDIPKGLRDPGETELEAAVRELYEETGLSLPPNVFAPLGHFAYRPDKDLYLFRADAPADLCDLDHLVCTSFFPHEVTGHDTPEVDGFRWAARADLGRLCWPRMGKLLTSLPW